MKDTVFRPRYYSRVQSLSHFFALSWLLWFLVSCERRELTYYMEAEITVTADWSHAGVPEEKDDGATLVIFPQDGGEPRVVLTGERERTVVRLPRGTYDAILFNRSFTDFSNLLFTGKESLESLEAYAKEVVTRADTRVIVSSPDKLASATVRNFKVTDDMLGNYAPPASRGACPEGACKMHFTPTPLTRHIWVTLNVKGLHNVREVRCTLDGVSLSVFLHDGHAGEELGGQQFTVGNPVFAEGSFTDGRLTGELDVFGFDRSLSHSIALKALLVDGKTVVEQMLTDIMVEEETDSAGNIMLYIDASAPEVFPDVKPEGGSDSGFDVDVDEWEDEEVDVPV